VFDVGGYAWTLQLAERFANDTASPRITAAGPLLSTADHWLNLAGERQFLPVKDAAAARAGAAYLAAQNAKAIKVWYLDDVPEALWAAGAAAAEAKLPLIVHATELSRAKAAVRAGAKLLVHSVWDAPVDDEFIALLKERGTILNPTLTVGGGYVRMFQAVVDRKAPAVDDPNQCLDPATLEKVASTAALDPSLVSAEQAQRRAARNGERERIGAANLKRLVDAGIPIATGTDAGNPLTLHGPSIHAEMEAMQKAGMTPMQVIVASTATAARAALVDGVTGTIEKGKDADLLVLAGDPSQDVANFRKLRWVVRAGVVRAVEELSAMSQRRDR
jgi:imidazolonepropionase-like amidohydrolase